MQLVDAKKYKKEGWKTNIGAPPLEIQFDQAWQKIAETDEDGFPKYLSVTVSAKDKDCDKAKFMAMELAQIRVANTLASQVEAVTRMNIDNEETCFNKSQSETEFVETSRINSAHHISKLNVILECWRQLADGDYEVRMMVAIPADNTKNGTK